RIGPPIPGDRDRPPFGGRGPFSEPGPTRSGPERSPSASGERNTSAFLRDPEAERRASLQWPRLLDPQGKGFGGPNPRPPLAPSTVKAALAGRDLYSDIHVGGDRVRVLSAPWYHDGEIVGAIQVARDLSELDRLRSGQVR